MFSDVVKYSGDNILVICFGLSIFMRVIGGSQKLFAS